MTSGKSSIDTDESYSGLQLLMFAVFGIWVVAGILILILATCGYLENLGQIGDSFGALNTLFSGMAFAVLIYTIHQQKLELRLQRLELEQTREELRGQKEQLAMQNQTFVHQQFDSTFFQTVDLHHRIVDEISIGNQSGRFGLAILGQAIRQEMNKPLFVLKPQERLDHASNEYMKVYWDHQYALAHYFRNLYRILKFVDESKTNDKRNYTGILRAQLSSPELVLLFFNCLSPNGRSKFKPLVEKYSMLEHIPKDEPFIKTFGEHYNASAFGEAVG